MAATEGPATSTAVATWEGGLRSRVATERFELVVDATGKREASDGPSPTGYLLVSLASCYAAALAWEARKRRIELPGLAVTATGTYDGPRFGHLLLTVRTDLPAAQLQQLLEPALRVCYVSNTITTPARIDIEVAEETPNRR